MNETAARPDLEALVLQRLKGFDLPAEVVSEVAKMLSEHQLHWWQLGKDSVRVQIREAIGL